MPKIIPIASILSLILVILGGVFLWYPIIEEAEKQKMTLDVKNQQFIINQSYYTETTQKLSKLETSYEEEIKKMKEAFPPDSPGSSVPDLFNFMINKVGSWGPSLNSISLGNISASGIEPHIEEISFSTSLTSRYDTFKEFLNQLYKNARVITIDSISFSSPGSEDFFDFTVSYKTYYYKEEPKIGADSEILDLGPGFDSDFSLPPI